MTLTQPTSLPLPTCQSCGFWLSACSPPSSFKRSCTYVRAARIAAPAAGISSAELKTSFRAGAVAAIGPSLAVVLVSVALLSLFGTPAVLVRVGLVGSAATETASASIAAARTMQELYRHLHAHPELSMRESETRAFLTCFSIPWCVLPAVDGPALLVSDGGTQVRASSCLAREVCEICRPRQPRQHGVSGIFRNIRFTLRFAEYDRQKSPNQGRLFRLWRMYP